MADKQCARCGELNPEESNLCSNCGAREFQEVPPHLSARLSAAPELEVTSAVKLGLARVALVSVLSFGLYLVYWFYLTWQQLASETRGKHDPVWHALTLFVPIYNLFRMHRHVSVIKVLAEGAGLSTSLAPGLAVVLFMVANALGFMSLRINDPLTLLVFGVLSTVLTTTIVVLTQGNLNQYWEKVKGADLREARIGVGEVVFVALGLLAWVDTLFPAE